MNGIHNENVLDTTQNKILFIIIMNRLLFTNIENLNHITLVIYVLLLVYIVFVIPNVDHTSIMLMDNLFVKLGVLFLIIYVSISNPLLAILLSLSFILTLQELNNVTKTEEIQKTTEIPLRPSKINPTAALQVKKEPTLKTQTGNYSLNASSSCKDCSQNIDDTLPEGPEGYLGGFSVLDNVAQL